MGFVVQIFGITKHSLRGKLKEEEFQAFWHIPIETAGNKFVLSVLKILKDRTSTQLVSCEFMKILS